MLTNMKPRTLVVGVVLAVLALTGCAGEPTAEPTSTVTPWSGPSAADRTPTPKPTPEAFAYVLTCHGGDYKNIEFDDFRAVWASPTPMIGCDAGVRSGDHLSEDQASALTTAYGHEKIESLGILYSICADFPTSSYGALPSYSANQVAEIRGMLALCPDQPRAAETHAKLDASAAIDAQRAAGTRFGAGIHQVNAQIQPGTYVTEGNLENCYWEKLDAGGNIIDNNFLTSALRVEVYIDGSEFSFSSSGCGEWVLQG